tara:strand:+ start:238 stop:585 length:348 start_codon:yes stop_codon:yes gene_type:complete
MITKKQYEEGFLGLAAHDKEQNDIRAKCLTYVATQVTIKLFDDIIEYIKDCDFTDRFEITEVKPKDNDKQSEDFDYLKEVWVDQYCDGGYVGDDYAGSVNININKKEYLKFHYSM